MALIHVSRSGTNLGTFEEEKVREGLRTGEFIGTDLGWMEGMANWRPLSELETFRTAEPAPAAGAAPLPSAEGSTPAAPLEAASATTRSGLPWENRETLGFVPALIETVKMILTRPMDAFAIMKREGGFVDPLLYAVIIGVIGAVVAFFYSFLFQSIGVGASGGEGIGALFGSGAMSFGMLILTPFIIAIVLFIWSGLIHLSLMLVGGANQSYETTFRVVGYSNGSANVLQLVPFCGSWLSAVAGIVLNCIGLSKAHETDTWKGVVAVFLPLVVCCGGGLMFFFLVLGGAAAAASWR